MSPLSTRCGRSQGTPIIAGIGEGIRTRPGVTQNAYRARMERLLLQALLPLWAAFAGSWAVLSTYFSLHLDAFPVPGRGSLSTNLVALVLYGPPALMLLMRPGVLPRDGALRLALLVLGWVLAALLIVGLALAAPIVIETATDLPIS